MVSSWMVCLTSATHKHKWYFPLEMRALSLPRETVRHGKKKKKKMRAADALSHPDIQSWHSVCQTLISAAQIPENKQAWRHGGISSRGSHCSTWVLCWYQSALFVDYFSTCGNANNFQRPSQDKFKRPNILGMCCPRGWQMRSAKAAFRNAHWQVHGLD